MSSAASGPAKPYSELQKRLGLEVDPELLERALTHRSYAYENGGLPTNERLEFLGDSVLGLVVTETLYRQHPDLPEGQLAKLRAAVVNMRALADVGRSLDLGLFVRLGRGEEGTGGRDKSSILADTLEAIIGAIYLDCGLEKAAGFVHRLFDPLIEQSATLGAGLDWKTSLQELTAEAGMGVPEYVVTESGPDHQKTFNATARVGGVEYGTGTGRSKKEAEQQAAEAAWLAIRAKLGRTAPDGAAQDKLDKPDRKASGKAASDAVGAETAPDQRDGGEPVGGSVAELGSAAAAGSVIEATEHGGEQSADLAGRQGTEPVGDDGVGRRE
ncbi:ribonuclease III [Carbonactinospora thermoautotrophica]|uniref:Ribonuclease 3 n=1 Tax=Carbonactinospora thermoautotrophica TaxID=1469144 RepID=A0A132MPK2_9ACTN|nr:ribonuclease III [Carbonactinospora thermoautotrophica]KWW99649.1 Ribonuclease 3 [Carbonactinospora thermoautotrophica]MCX9191784.1 ribonuclease III [Carbonactinospora thermoautotrophica]